MYRDILLRTHTHSMTDTSIWNQEVSVPRTVISYTDPNVIQSKLVIIRGSNFL